MRVKAIYLHHELIRINPFVDGNARVTWLAENWMLMYNLYRPIYIKIKKQSIVEVLGNSFKNLRSNKPVWNKYISLFFNQEINRRSKNIDFVLNEMKKTTGK